MNTFFSFFPCFYTILHSAFFFFFFNLTLSHEHFFISLNIDGQHHSKLFSSPSDRTSHCACSASVPGCLVRPFWKLVALHFRNSSSWRWYLVTEGPPGVLWPLDNGWSLMGILWPSCMSFSLIIFLIIPMATAGSPYTSLAGQSGLQAFATPASPSSYFNIDTNHPL